MSLIKNRILEFIDYKGISKYKFYKETGITRGVLESKSGITEDNISKFINYYPSVNLEWLFRGEGEFEISSKDNTKENESFSTSLEIDQLKDNLLNLLVNDNEIKNAFANIIGKEINMFASKKITNLVKDEDFFRVITNYLSK